jgi:hypothetical protein
MAWMCGVRPIILAWSRPRGKTAKADGNDRWLVEDDARLRTDNGVGRTEINGRRGP